jgi:lipopolysaccharide heptosyltransferase II
MTLVKKLQTDRIERILLSRLRFMGDVILTTPLIRQLKKTFPAARLSYLTQDTFAPLLLHHPHLDEVISFSMHGSFIEQARFYRQLRQRCFDLAIDLFGNPRTALMTWATGARVRVGGDFRGRGKLYNVRVPAPAVEPNAIDFHWRSLAALGIEKGDDRTEIFIAPAEKKWARECLAGFNIDPARPAAGLHPGATWPNKRWPEKYFAELALQLYKKDIQVIITQGPGEESIAQEVIWRISAQQRDAMIVLLPVLSLRQLASVQQQLRVFVSNDCGVMHLAVAVGTPTIGLFGPSQPHIWFPYDQTEGHLALWQAVECRPCHKNFCPLGHLDCQNNLAPERVAAAVMERLSIRRSDGLLD